MFSSSAQPSFHSGNDGQDVQAGAAFMLFTQFEFIFIYLPVVLAGYFLISRLVAHPLARLVWLAVASLAFYSYWDYHFVPIIAASILFNYCLGIIVGAHPVGSRSRVITFAIAVVANLAALAFYKYANFGIDTINALAGKTIPAANIVLPLGISFFTFTQIAYLADVYKGYASERGFTKYVLFVTYFPHLIAGPILHHREMMPQFGSDASSRFSPERTALGLTIFGIGLFKKSVIADGFALIANPVFSSAAKGAITTMDAWGGALAYSLQIYFDFSGYCDMAIGLSLMFGILLPFNFDSPYKARSIVDFWRRWHITLSRFLRDYLYIPLGGNRSGPIRQNTNLLATMLLGGLWHGAGWTYVIWGGLHGLYLVINHVWTTRTKKIAGFSKWSGTLGYMIAALLLTQFAVVIAWVFFRADSTKAALNMLKGMAWLTSRPEAGAKAVVTLMDFGLIASGYLICFVLPNVNTMFEKWKIGLDTYKLARPWSLVALPWSPSIWWAGAATATLIVAVFVSLIAGDGSQFLYFQF
jgi:alginate O-acetyltransferase complex protein AlgI